ncbi:MAG: type II toxin-antitoxin system VapC family toxin [Acidobacteria bacterium]|nr:type II toxin-antitoxin system VapC family toxin [Acidobacteriota bacterium]
MVKTRKRVLLDTNVFLWIFLDPRRVPPGVKSFLRDPERKVFLSYASSLEIAIKFSIKRLALPEAPSDFVRNRVERAGWMHLPVELDHVFEAGRLPFVHKDPFDRLILAQARREDLTVISSNRKFKKYKADVLSFADLRK